MAYYLGIDVGGTKIAFGLFDEERRLLKKGKKKTDDQLENEAFFRKLSEEIRAFLAENQVALEELDGVGIGFPGFIDFDSGTVVRAPSLPGILNFGAAAFLQKELGGSVRIVLDNDCHCGALAEYRRGAGRGHRHMLYCPVSTGISTGIIIDGKLFRGSNGASGESGHMLTGVEGDLKIGCGCGNSGCFNSLCSGKAITSHIRRWIENGKTTVMTQLAGSPEAITAVHVNEAYELGDALAIRAVDQMAEYMAMWLFDIYMLLNIDCIVLAGGLLVMGDKLFKTMKDRFEAYHGNTNPFPVTFLQSELESDSGLLGAVELLF